MHSCNSTSRLVLIACFAVWRCFSSCPCSVKAFFVAPGIPSRRLSRLNINSNAETTHDADMDDTTLLETVTKSQLVNLCQQVRVDSEGTKEILLQRLRQHAALQAQNEREVALKRAEKVQEGASDENSKERYELVGDDEPDSTGQGDAEDSFFYYFEAPDGAIDFTPTKPESKSKTAKSVTHNAQGVITAPPPPPETETNADGERVVTVYSTTEENDLTGIAAAQPGGGGVTDSLFTAGASSSSNGNQPQPWDMPQTSAETTNAELQQATEQVTELVSLLLATSGAPAFAAAWDEDELAQRIPTYQAVAMNEQFVGFNPTNIPTELLNSFSSSLRTGKGQVLQDVLRKFEMQAIGQDGMHGDNTEKGGGHYREVAKVRAFLDGYRRAEVRRLARETTAMLLDKLVTEGVEGLDITLAAMARTSDENSEFAGELNDSLVRFLNDAIRQQEKKVDQLVAERMSQKTTHSSNRQTNDQDDSTSDTIDNLWNVTMEDGQQVESIDPNDPKVQSALQKEYEKSNQQATQLQTPEIPDTAPEKLLLLLTLLRERIKAEAAFSLDEKGRNLRLLAYCLRLSTDEEREQLILKQVGNSLDVSDMSPDVFY